MSDTVTTISPEGFDIAQAYLTYGSAQDTAEQLQLPLHQVVETLNQPAVKRFLDGVYLDQGYRNRDKLSSLLDRIIDHKLAEAEDSELYSNKDLVDIIMLAHKLRIEELKASRDAEKVGVAVQVNTNNTFGDSAYGKLMENLLK